MLHKEGYSVSGVAKSVDQALKLVNAQKPDLVLLDIFLKGPQTGIDLAEILRQQNIPFIYLSANSNKATLDAAKKTCPAGFLVKPVREKDVLIMLEIARFKHTHGLEAVTSRAPTTKPCATGAHSVHGIIGNSSRLKEIIYHIEIVAPTDTGVLILGESGTGKEKLAAAIHDLSLRRSGPFIKVNCAALPPNLIESILFGHEKGAFTGAVERCIGKFEQAQNGTIFLDEIGEMIPEVQVKLLRVLQENEIERVGGKSTIPLNVRVIAATNRNLEKEVAEGRFRMDLYYRLNTFPLEVPALRERKEDIPILANHFLAYYCQKLSKPPMTFAEKQWQELLRYHWPGNIRELQHVIERSVLLTFGPAIEKLNIPGRFAHPTTSAPEQAPLITSFEDQEKQLILRALRHCNWKIGGRDGAATFLKIPPTTLSSKMKRLGIRKEHVS